MGTRHVKLEVVTYRTSDIAHATGSFLYNFAKYSDIFGADQWMRSWLRMRDVIEDQSPQELVLSAEGIEVRFSGFPKPIPQIGDEGVIFRSSEPRLVIMDSAEGLLPSGRTYVMQVTDAISQEMEEVYRLQVERNPHRLIFTKEEYARDITVFDAALIV